MKYTKNNAIQSKHLIHNPLNSCNIHTKLDNSPICYNPYVISEKFHFTYFYY